MPYKPWHRSRPDYPDGVLAIYDNGGRTADRYTVVYLPWLDDWNAPRQQQWIYPYVGMSAAPFHPHGVCQHGESRFRPHGDWDTRRGSGMGRCIRYEGLPSDCQTVVQLDLGAFARQEQEARDEATARTEVENRTWIQKTLVRAPKGG